LSIELNIKKLLKKKDATIEDLADFIKVTRPGLYGMMRNETITLAKLRLTSEYFDVTINDLVNETPVNSFKYDEKLMESAERRISTLEELNMVYKKKINELEKSNRMLTTQNAELNEELRFLRGKTV